MHVRNWEFEIVNDDEEEDFEFVVEQIYPGMPEEVQKITARNHGETEAKLTCNIFYVRIFDEEFEAGKEGPDGKIYTYLDLLEKIKKGRSLRPCTSIWTSWTWKNNSFEYYR